MLNDYYEQCSVQSSTLRTCDTQHLSMSLVQQSKIKRFSKP